MRKRKASRRDSRKNADMERSLSDDRMAKRKSATFDAQVSLRIDHYRLRLADPDGLSAKAAIDGLVHCGVLRDDSAEEIKEIRHFQHKVAKASLERTIITIEAID